MTINALPNEVLVNVASYLTPKKQARFSSVSKLFRSVCNDEALWRFHTQHDFTQLCQPKAGENWKEAYKQFYLKYDAFQKNDAVPDISRQLFMATYLGCEQKLLPLLEDSNLDINQKLSIPDLELPLLNFAVMKKHLHIVTALLERGADPNVTDQFKHTPLHAAAKDGSIELVKLLIEKGADLNAQDENGLTAMHYAARKGATQVVEFLIEKGADIDPRDQMNGTPLHHAAYEKQRKLMEVLIERGADPNIRNVENETPLQSIRRVRAMNLLPKFFVASLIAGTLFVAFTYFKHLHDILNEK